MREDRNDMIVALAEIEGIKTVLNSTFPHAALRSRSFKPELFVLPSNLSASELELYHRFANLTLRMSEFEQRENLLAYVVNELVEGVKVTGEVALSRMESIIRDGFF
jgi:hypothetical protein